MSPTKLPPTRIELLGDQPISTPPPGRAPTTARACHRPPSRVGRIGGAHDGAHGRRRSEAGDRRPGVEAELGDYEQQRTSDDTRVEALQDAAKSGHATFVPRCCAELLQLRGWTAAPSAAGQRRCVTLASAMSAVAASAARGGQQAQNEEAKSQEPIYQSSILPRDALPRVWESASWSRSAPSSLLCPDRRGDAAGHHDRTLAFCATGRMVAPQRATVVMDASNLNKIAAVQQAALQHHRAQHVPVRSLEAAGAQ